MPLDKQDPSRIVLHEHNNFEGFTSENSLAKMELTNPDKITPVITWLLGKEDKRFPLTHMTEGQKGGTKPIAVNDIQYTYPVMGRLRQADVLVRVEGVDLSADDIGAGGDPVFFVFKTNFVKKDHTIMSPSGVRVRVQTAGVKVSGGYKYEGALIYRDAEENIPAEELAKGVNWSMTTGANVAASDSKGNASNSQSPGEVKNQISILRKSYHIAGNVNNKTVEFQFNTGKGTTNAWMPFEEWQHRLEFKRACEEHLWETTYNRDKNGNITTIDKETGLPIPMGAGVDDQIPNKDTYGQLTTKKITSTMTDVFFGASDTSNMDIVLYTGTGGAQEFDNAIKNAGKGMSGVFEGDSNGKLVGGKGGSNALEYGAYFNTYNHVDGHRVTIKILPFLDDGGRASNAPKHPITGLPMTSYDMYFLDHSTYEGMKNIQMVHEKGRSMIRGMEQGMALVKGSHYGDYEGNASNLTLSTDQDRSSMHLMKTLGVNIRRNTHCFKLSCDLS